MTDRVAALGDSILVGSEPGRGTTVSGGIPTRTLAEVTG
jgi:signal transduction histidine kinase